MKNETLISFYSSPNTPSYDVMTSASRLRPVCGGFHNLIRFNCSPFFASCRRHRVLTVTCLNACRCAAYLRHEPSSPPRILGSWVRISLRNMDVLCVRLFCVCVVLCLGSGLATRWSLVQESYRLCKNDYETEEEAKAQRRAIEPLMNEYQFAVISFNGSYCLLSYAKLCHK
jgi:hypothetical protein